MPYADPERQRAWLNDWRQRNLNKVRLSQRESKQRWRSENPGANAAAQKKWRGQNLERAQELDRERHLRDGDKRRAAVYSRVDKLRTTPEGWPKLAEKAAITRAKKSNTPHAPFAKSVELVAHCPIRGVAIEYGKKRAGSATERNGPSLDRIVPALGYVPGNVRIISFYANVLKRDCTDPAIFDRLAAYLRGEL